MVMGLDREVKIGFVPPRELSFRPTGDGENSPVENFIQGMGFDSPNTFWTVYSHILLSEAERRPTPAVEGETTHTMKDSFPDPFALLNMLAHVTQYAELFTSVIVAPQMALGDLTSRIAAIANLSRGRFRFGGASGWSLDEFKGLGVGDRFDHRGKFFEEQIPILKRLLSGEVVDITIEREKIQGMGINPAANYPVPFWLGGGLGSLDDHRTIEVLERIAEWSDGYMPLGNVGPFLERRPILFEMLDKHGRDITHFGVMGRVTLARKSLGKCVDDYLAWKDAGATHILLTTFGQDRKDWQFHRDLIREFLGATRWIHSPDEGINKTFSRADGWPAPKEFSLGGDSRELMYFFLQEEIDPRFLEGRLKELGYELHSWSGQTEVRLSPYKEEAPFTITRSYLDRNDKFVMIAQQGTREDRIAVFYEK